LLFKQIISRLIFKPLDDTEKINIEGPAQIMISEADNIFVKDEAKDKTEQGED